MLRYGLQHQVKAGVLIPVSKGLTRTSEWGDYNAARERLYGNSRSTTRATGSPQE